jgi:phosphoglycerate dehydrogenase-like enzyme
MKPGAVIINVGRGPVIERSGHAARAHRAAHQRRRPGRNSKTNPCPPDTRSTNWTNVLLSPHCADHTSDWTEQAMRFFLAQFERYSSGAPLQNVVTKHLGLPRARF